jgi:hypothetical protein
MFRQTTRGIGDSSNAIKEVGLDLQDFGRLRPPFFFGLSGQLP